MRSGGRARSGAGLRRPPWRAYRRGFLCGDSGAAVRARSGFPGGRRWWFVVRGRKAALPKPFYPPLRSSLASVSVAGGKPASLKRSKKIQNDPSPQPIHVDWTVVTASPHVFYPPTSESQGPRPCTSPLFGMRLERRRRFPECALTAPDEGSRLIPCSTGAGPDSRSSVRRRVFQ